MDDDGLELEVDALESVAEPHRSLYAEDGGKFRLKVKGLPDVTGLNTALEKERRQAKALAAQLKGYTVDGKPLDIEALKQERAELEELRQQKELFGKGSDEKAQALADKVRKEFGVQVEQLTSRLTAAEQREQAAQQRFRQNCIERALDEASQKMKVRPEFYDDVRMRAAQFTVLDDEPDPKKNVVMVGADGEPVISTKQGQRYVYATDFLESVRPDKPLWFEGSGGGGAPGSAKTSTGRVIDRNDPSAVLGNLEAMAAGKVQVQ